MNSTDNELVEKHIKKLRNVFSVIVRLIALFELVLAIKGLFTFNLERLKHRLYLYSYIFLFSVSAAAFIIIKLCGKNDTHTKLLIAQNYAYSFCLIGWAAFVSAIDCISSGDSGVMVYVMVSISVGALTLLKPRYFIPMLASSGCVMLYVIYYARNAFFSTGFYINFLIFAVLATFINSHNYRLNKREFEISKKLETLSFTDQLTGVYNRRLLDKHISEYLSAHKTYLFILIDIDDFKAVNDSFGHSVGDSCLVALSEKLKYFFGNNVYRFGGDEFAVISPLIQKHACENIDKINYELKQEYKDISLHISAGIYQTTKSDSAREIFTYTDRALYQAKRTGKNNWAIYNHQKTH